MTSSRIALIALLCVGCNTAVDEKIARIHAEKDSTIVALRYESRLARLARDSARCVESHCYCLDTAGWGSAGIRIAQDGRVELGKTDHFVDANKKVDTGRWWHLRWNGQYTGDSIWSCEPRGGGE